MKIEIVDRGYSYHGGNICGVSGTLNVLSDGGAVIATTNLSSSFDISQPGSVEELSNSLSSQVVSFVSKLTELEEMRRQLFPASSDFPSAVDIVFDQIEAATE